MDAFFGLVPIDDATAQSLYNHVVKAMTDVGIPYKENLIGLAADGANVMMGKHNSLSSRLKEDIPTLFILKCVCHSFHLCASYVRLTLPRSVEGLARDVYNYLSSSPKRTSELKEFQIFVDIKPHKLLHPSQTRWLSLHMVVSRLLEQFEALILYFTNAVWEDRILAAQSILDNLKDPRNRLYLEFLDFILPYFNNLNKQMQAESPQIYTLHEAVCNLCRNLMDCYMNEDYLRKTSVENVQYQDPRHFMPLQNMYLGPKVTASISNNIHGLPQQAIEEFRKRCLGFFIESVRQICMRFDFRNPILKRMSAIDPKSVVKREVASIAPLASLLPGIVKDSELNDLDREWRSLRNKDNLDSNMPVEEFWNHIRKMKTGDDRYEFPVLINFVFSILSLPHSSAAAERIFSAVNVMKTKQRNRLSTQTLCGLLHSKRYLKDNTCFNFPVDKLLISKMNSSLYVDDSD
ncbi:zinc finger protein 862-like [Macrobrachium rosenbergii]|uniref:zinc finger protein 862-like n=1 Tax=Macrobrachium rosenbergii TaxID=79674 RepID=UPI0034D6E9AF